MTAAARPRVALAHDVLAARAGGERVLAALAGMYPQAPIHTLIHNPAATFGTVPSDRVVTSWLDRLPGLHGRYRAALPAAALTWQARQIDADITICSTSGLSHHVRTTGAKVVYCHTPPRWIHAPDHYLVGYRWPVRSAAALLRRPFAALDRQAMRSADLVLTNSTHIAGEIAALYGIEATVVAPCSTLELDGPTSALGDIEPGFVLAPVRPLGYKRLDLLVAAARRRPGLQFVQIGDGPHRRTLTDSAPANLVSLGAVGDDQLRWAYRNARVCALTWAEDYGLVPLEAAAHGLATVAPEARGILDHDPDTIVGYPAGSLDGLLDALDRAPEPTGRFVPGRLGQARFAAEIEAAVAGL